MNSSKSIKTINGTKEVKYVGNTKLSIEWVNVYMDDLGNHYIYNGGGYYKEITAELYDIFTV